MGGMMAIQAICLVVGCAMQAKPAPMAVPLVSRPQVEAAGLTIYWDRNITLLKNEQVLRISRLDENVYVITNQGRAIALDAVTGVLRWTVKIADPNIRIEGPTHGPDGAYFATVLSIQVVDARRVSFASSGMDRTRRPDRWSRTGKPSLAEMPIAG